MMTIRSDKFWNVWNITDIRVSQCSTDRENMLGALRKAIYFGGSKEITNLNLKLAEMVSIQEVGRRLDYKPVRAEAKMEDLMEKAMEQNFVPVVDDQGNFSGIITRKDIIGYFYDKLVVSDKEK